MPIYSVKEEITIPNGSNKTEALKTSSGFYLAAVITPIINTSAAITYEVSHDGLTFVPLFNSAGTAVSYAIDNSKATAIPMEPTEFYPWEYVKLVVADNQSADRVFSAIIREY